ncbi:hypothetical protein Taro_039044 [Colocasia esculenta]|uniref:Uncharacterized protein n=1 Tax=Colocasia esculenta TaxID=4460 RepID=A0A843W587_COLES|nr:hypothetical protein [Colocasia esculenta]
MEVDSRPPETPMGEAVAGVADPLPTSRVASILREVLDSFPSTSVTSEIGGLTETEAMAPGHIERSNVENIISEEPTVAQGEVVMDEAPTEGEQIASVSQVSTSVVEGHIEMEEAPSQVEPFGSEPQMSESVAEGHSEDIVLEEAPTLREQENVVKSAPIQGEQELGTEEAPSQGEPIENAPVNEGPSTGHGEFDEPVPQRKIRKVVHRRQGKGHKNVYLKPVMDILKVQGDILSSVQSSVQGILASQATATSELSSVRNAMWWFNKELSDMKTMLSAISKIGGLSPSATQSRPAAVPRPPGPPAQESGPSGPSVQASGPSGRSAVVSEGQAKGKEPVAATKAHETSTLATPISSSLSSSSTAPPAPPTFKHPMPRTQTSSSIIPSQPSFSPTSSQTSAPSSPLSKTTSVHPSSSFNPKHLFYPPTPPSSVTFIPESPQIHSDFDTNLPDDFEISTLISILSTATHVHRTDPPSPSKKKRKNSSSCERLSPSVWETLYKEPHLQLQAINSFLIRQAKPILSAEAFLDLNSINPMQEIYVQWATRYTAFYALKKDLLDQKILYPISLDRFLHRASFGKSTYFRFILDRDQYGEFLEEQRQLYIQRITPTMGSSFSVAPDVFHQTFEDMEIKAWAVISQHASLLSPLYYLTPN